MMRKILYSPGWGAGWTSWNSGKVAQIMLTYPPIVEFIEAGGRFTDDDIGRGGKPTHPLLQRLIADVKLETGNDDEYVCVLGANDLRVAVVEGRVRIDEYDGNEFYCEEGTPEHESEWQ